MPADPAPTRTELRAPAWLGVALAMVFPTFVTWAYFYQVAAMDQGIQQGVMGTLKLMQFALPVAWVCFVLRERIAWRRLTTRGVATGVLFGVAVSVAGWLVFRLLLEGSGPFQAAIEPIRAKVAGFGIESPAEFVALAAFYSLVHSLLEEYYWRWFVFGQLRRLVPLWPAIVASALAFAAHHVLVLSWYFGWWSAPTLLLSAAVAIGGGFWAWLYDRSGSLVGPWLSHLIIDAGIFVVGYQLLRDTWS